MRITLKKHKTISYGLILLILCAFISIAYIMHKPPLRIEGIRQDNTQLEKKSLSIRNDGIFPLSLSEVLVNGEEQPINVELGVSRFTNVQGFGHDTPDVSFHDLKAYKVNPMPIEKEMQIYEEIKETGERDRILHYGLMIYHDKPIESVTIEYSYLGIPLYITH